MSLVAARGIAKSVGGASILRVADLDVEADAGVAILGPDRGGKSALLAILAGIY